jgi:nucleolar pre-ribosomal-associated protein 1
MEEAIRLATQVVVRSAPLYDTAHGSDEAEPLKTSGLYPSYAMDESVDVWHSYQSWLDCVVLLWRVAMKSSRKLPSWDVLTCQLLASQLHGRSTHVEIEWVRKEVVWSLQK